jgi:hypothetical protein
VGEPGQGAATQSAPLARAGDHAAEIAALRRDGAGQLDALRFLFIEVLARRLHEAEGAPGRVLEGRLAAELALCRRRIERQRDEAGQAIERTVRRHPDAAGELQRLFAAADFAGIDRFVGRLAARDRRSPLAALAGAGARSVAQDDAVLPTGDDGAHGELRSLRLFRNTWAQRAALRQAAQAIERAPANAGPLNSHLLVLRSLAAMRDLSPDYLNRFVSHADTLLRLDQAGRKGRRGARGGPQATGGGRT